MYNLNSMLKGDVVGILGAVNVGGLFNSQGNSCSSLVIVAGCNNGNGGNINVLNGDSPLADVAAKASSTIQNVGIGYFGVGNILSAVLNGGITHNLGLTSSLLTNF